MSERPFMRLYTGGFVATTLALNTEEIGAYTLLLMAAWQQGGSLPADMDLAGQIARLEPERWAETWAALSPLFDIKDGRLVPQAFREWARAWVRIYGRTPLPLAVRVAILERDGARCRYCGTEDGPFHIDHIKPVVQGGTDDPGNLGVACVNCNLSKGGKSLKEWLE